MTTTPRNAVGFDLLDGGGLLFFTAVQTSTGNSVGGDRAVATRSDAE
jgi:hypothetical protein